MRDPSLLVYFRPESGGLIMGGYERNPAPWSLDGIPADFNGKLLAEDWPRFEELMENAIVRVPTPRRGRGRQADQRPRGVHAGRRVHPRPDRGARPLDRRGLLRARARGRRRDGAARRRVDRRGRRRRSTPGRWTRAGSAAHYRSREYTLARTLEVYETYYDVKYPGHERQAGRPLRLSPTYPRLAELGAAFGEKSGWERANWFEPNAARGDESLRPRGWAGRLWSPAIGAEHRACRETRGALRRDVVREDRGLGRRAPPPSSSTLCANRVARDVGAITYTQMLNARGGIECDFTVTRLAETRFRIVTGTAFGQHDLAWIRQHAPDGRRRRRRDLELRLPRPLGAERARDPAAADDHARSTSRYMRARELSVGRVPCLALRVTYVGELGWELYCPTEFGLALWDTIWESGREHGLVAGGYKAIDSLRLEKGYRVWGADITPDDTPVRGRARLRRQARQGRLPRPRGAARAAGAGAAAALPRPRRPARGRARLGAGARRRPPGRPRHERRLRLHGRALDRLRLPPGRELRDRPHGRGRDLRRVGRRRGRRRAALRPAGRPHPRDEPRAAAALPPATASASP